MTQAYDPREQLTHDITVGQVYGDARSKEDGEYEEELRLVYEDDERVLLRSNKKLTHGRNSGSQHYRCEFRDIFEKHAAEGRYELLEDPDDPPLMPTDGVGTALTVLKRLRSEAKHQVNNGGGRKEKHRLEAFDEAVEAVANLDPTSIEWESVDGVGQKTAENLNEAGIETDVDVQSASDEQLLSIGGVGEKNLQNIKEEAGAA